MTNSFNPAPMAHCQPWTVAGATLTSQAFMRSLDSALTQAGGLPSIPGAPATTSKLGGTSIGI